MKAVEGRTLKVKIYVIYLMKWIGPGCTGENPLNQTKITIYYKIIMVYSKSLKY